MKNIKKKKRDLGNKLNLIPQVKRNRQQTAEDNKIKTIEQKEQYREGSSATILDSEYHCRSYPLPLNIFFMLKRTIKTLSYGVAQAFPIHSRLDKDLFLVTGSLIYLAMIFPPWACRGA